MREIDRWRERERGREREREREREFLALTCSGLSLVPLMVCAPSQPCGGMP